MDMPSSVVSSMHYDSSSSTLRIIYVSGEVYDYLGVPGSIYKAMKSSGSKGTYLNKYIKGHYQFKKVSITEGFGPGK
jgi:hypothetical protein